MERHVAVSWVAVRQGRPAGRSWPTGAKRQGEIGGEAWREIAPADEYLGAGVRTGKLDVFFLCLHLSGPEPLQVAHLEPEV